MRNPAFRSPAFSATPQAAAPTLTAAQLEELYAQPSAQRPSTEPMTYQDTLLKSALTFAILITGAVVGWLTAETVPFLWIAAAGVGFVLALVNTFKREPSATLILIYAAAQGVFLGGISTYFEAMYPGIVAQTVLATFLVVGVTLALFASGRIRASKTATKIFLVAMVAYLLFSLVNVVLMLTGVNTDPWGLSTSVTIAGIPLGVILGILAVLMGAYSLVLDFDFIQRGVRNGAPRRYGWSGAFGIMVTVIWLYVEILRLIAIARR